jgi:hypothetical protein
MDRINKEEEELEQGRRRIGTREGVLDHGGFGHFAGSGPDLGH